MVWKKVTGLRRDLTSTQATFTLLRFGFKNEYLLLHLHLAFTLLWRFRAPKPEEFENTSDPVLVRNLQGCVENGDLWQHRHWRQRFAA